MLGGRLALARVAMGSIAGAVGFEEHAARVKAAMQAEQGFQSVERVMMNLLILATRHPPESHVVRWADGALPRFPISISIPPTR
jgi:hypothetical protein